MIKKQTLYGKGDSSYIAAGEREGIFRLVEDFYHAMDTLPEAKRIRDMHKEDISEVKDKLALFLCMWLNGPRWYTEKYGSIAIPRAHHHLDIGPEDRDAWLLCMKTALEKQDYAEDFKEYLLTQLYRPANFCRTR